MVEIALAIIAAAGTVATAYVIHVLGDVRRQTNGALELLEWRVRMLEVVLTPAKAVADHEPLAGYPREHGGTSDAAGRAE